MGSIPSLVGEQRSYMLNGMAKKKIKILLFLRNFAFHYKKYTDLPTTQITMEDSLIILDIFLPQCLIQSRNFTINTD